MASGFKIADAYVKATLDRDQLRSDIAGLPAEVDADVDRAGKDVGKRLGKGIGDGADGKTIGRRVGDDVDSALGPRAQKSGSDSGDKLAQGMRLAMVRNSPLIAAAVAGGLIAGGPLLLGAATALFVGVAAVAVHSNAQIQSAFDGTKDAITSTFTNAAQVTVPFFVSALGRIGAAVQALGPQLHAAFVSMGAPIDSLTTGLIGLMNNVMPGLVAAVRSADPVFQGLASMLAQIGAGLGQMFQILSEHSQAAGTVFATLGSILGALLPILGQLVGAGAELAATVLPPVAAALHLVAEGLNAIAPVLPGVLAGFLAFQAVGALSGPMGTLSAKLQTVAADSEGLAGKLAARLAPAAAGVAGALPGIGWAIAGIVAVLPSFISWVQGGPSLMDRVSASAKGITQALAESKGAIDANVTSAAALVLQQNGLFDASAKWGVSTQTLTQAALGNKDAMDQVTAAHAAYDKALNTNVLGLGIYNASAADATSKSDDWYAALQRLASGTDNEVQKQHDLAVATGAATQAMVDQANEALAAADSQFAYQQRVFATKDAEIALKDAIKQHGAASEQAQKAALGLDQALLQQAEAAGKAAADASGLTDKTDLARVSQQATLKSLLDLKQQYGSEFPAALDQTIAQLEAAGVHLDEVGAKKPTPTVELNKAPFDAGMAAANGAVGNLAAQRPTPVAGLNPFSFNATMNGLQNALSGLGARVVYPAAWVQALGLSQAEAAIDRVARNRVTYITTLHTGAAATGGKVGDVVGLAGKRFDAGGKISGAGGPTDDLVPAMTLAGVPLRVSNEEWVIPGAPSKMYGDAKMAAIVAGTAQVSLPAPRVATPMAPGGGPAGAGNTYNLNVTVAGTVDFTRPGFADQIARPIRDAIVRLERAAH